MTRPSPSIRPQRVIRRPVRIAGLMFLGARLLGGPGRWLAPAEPAYEGRSISEWVHDAARPGPWTGRDAARDQQVRQSHAAIPAIGTNGVPTMLRLFHARDSRLKVMANQWLKKQSPVPFHFPDEWQLQRRAPAGFSILGTNAEGARPALQQDLKNDSGQTRNLARLARDRMTNSPRAVPPAHGSTSR